ncbi:hypothetical protein JCM21900_003800 [Sporobolomyces salmonicolor]
MSSPAFRGTRKTARLASALHNLRAGPSARRLPPLVSSLSVRYDGLKGSAGARHWAKATLPGLTFANPDVKVVVEKGKAPAAEGDEPWTATPGVTISFHDPSLPPAFFPLPQQRSDKLVAKWWGTVGDEAKLRALAAGEAVELNEADPLATVAEAAALGDAMVEGALEAAEAEAAVPEGQARA